ncbi:hypothetical protein IW262DRAFT_1295692 [Armillaria fumosa]|nr:hypothetical protein IW262DRAFT_1295692 [Armillaria fumosa]
MFSLHHQAQQRQWHTQATQVLARSDAHLGQRDAHEDQRPLSKGLGKFTGLGWADLMQKTCNGMIESLHTWRVLCGVRDVHRRLSGEIEGWKAVELGRSHIMALKSTQLRVSLNCLTVRMNLRTSNSIL